jgi:tartrate dehydrogenase/decarboxylase/D-malate dehydrogenase
VTGHRIAAIPGDGIGKEVLPAAQRVLDAAAARLDVGLSWCELPWSCAWYAEHGAMMPADGIDRLRETDAIFLGAVGWPGVPDHVSLWGLIIPIRRAFDQYINLCPVRLLPGLESPLRDCQGFDVAIVRENTEGECSDVGGRYSTPAGDVPYRSRSSPVAGVSGCCGTRSTWPASAAAAWPRPPSRTGSCTPCRSGTR